MCRMRPIGSQLRVHFVEVGVTARSTKAHLPIPTCLIVSEGHVFHMILLQQCAVIKSITWALHVLTLSVSPVLNGAPCTMLRA